MNVEKLIKKINKKNFLFHTIGNTNMWIFGEKNGKDWIFTLSEQDSNAEFILGTTKDKLINRIWERITTKIEENLEIEGIAKELKTRINDANKFDRSKFNKFLDTSTKLHIKIPKSNCYVIAEKESNNSWKLELENEKSKKKKTIKDKITNEDIGIVLRRISNKKHLPTKDLNKLANLIKSYID